MATDSSKALSKPPSYDGDENGWQQRKFVFMGHMSAVCVDTMTEINKATRSSVPCGFNTMSVDETKRSGVLYGIFVHLWKKRALSNLQM